MRPLLGAALRALATLWVVGVVAWLCVEAAPGDVRERAARVAGLLPAEGARVDAAARARAVAGAAAARGVGSDVAARVWAAAVGPWRGDLGTSWRDGASVAGHVARKLPVTLGLVGLAAGIVLVVGGAGAIVGARGGRGDGAVRVLASLALAVPVAWVAVLALRAFAWGRPWSVFPVRGGWLLPATCLALVAAALLARHGRAALVDALAQPWALAARARGVGRERLLLVHGARAAAAPLCALAPTLVVVLLGTAPVVERAFDVRGLGALLIDAAQAGDAPLVRGAALCAGAVVAVVSIVAEALAVRFDPRGRA